MGILFILFLTGNLYGNILTQMNFHIQIFGITKVKKKTEKAFVFKHQEFKFAGENSNIK